MKIKIVEIDNLEEYIKQNQIAIIDYYADWCRPCIHLIQYLKKLDPPIQIARINCQKNMDICEKQNIKGIPTIEIYINQKKIKRIVGFNTEKIRKLIGILMETKDLNQIKKKLREI